MASTTNTGTSVSRLAALHIRRDKDADFTLSCQGTNIPAHSFLLASTSEYFEIALSKDWLEKKEKKMDIKECSVSVLHVAVNFMYGINIPEEFKEYRDLIHLADLFMMDNLKEVIEERLEKALSKANYLEISQIADLYSNTSLITKCGNFMYEEFGDGDEINWEEMGKLTKVMTAFGKSAMKAKEGGVPLKVMNKREDFASDEAYGKYVVQNVEKGSVVRLRQDYRCRPSLQKGDLVIVDSKTEERGTGGYYWMSVIVANTERKVSFFSHRVKFLDPHQK